MSIVNFCTSKDLSLGIELELQLINPLTFDLSPDAKALIRDVHDSKYNDQIKPEITQSMLEINSSVHQDPHLLEDEIHAICEFLKYRGKKLGILLSGGGSHPFQHWNSRKIFPTHRFRNVSKRYGYLAKRFTVFGQHIHIGCSDGDQAIYLTHMLSRYVPQFIALSASSPFYQGIDSGYCSSRVNIVNAFPLCGVMPYVDSWKAFTQYYEEMLDLKIIDSMKDFYWDIRPKPEFGTVEVRICDTPLTVKKSVMIAAYIQTLARYILSDQKNKLTPHLYLVYNHNRFQASRYGYDGDFINPFTKAHLSIQEDILATFNLLRPHAEALGTEDYLKSLKKEVLAKRNDAARMKEVYSQHGNLAAVVKYKTDLLSKVPNKEMQQKVVCL